ncbi:ScbR family autoregulator-binding transcription factor [Streptomyces sp. NPDC006551]|uniref:ScbR family autoregulator-binding transcription factor n=1 Tax=Streptomyces sp. NPDC006551 TaxID=3157178 RepID=UPI0033A4DD19
MAKQHRALRTRQELIRSASEVFYQVGFADSSINAISSRTGMSNGAVHFHFGNKRALGNAIERAAARNLLCVTGRIPLRHPAPLQHLVDTSHALARCLLNDPVLRAGFGLGTDATWQGDGDLWEQWQDWVQLMLTVARDQGSLAPDVCVEDAVYAVTAVVAGVEVRARRDAAWCSRQAVTRFWRLMLPRLASERVARSLVPEGTTTQAWPPGESGTDDLMPPGNPYDGADCGVA